MAIDALEDACEKAQPLLFRFNEALHPWVTFLTMPALALANAGVVLSGDLASRAAEPVTLGVAIGLLLGKPIGITLLSWLAVKAGWAGLPGTSVHGAAWLGGIGFTMSLFIGALAFSDAELLAQAKLGILAGSLAASPIGSTILLPSVSSVAGLRLPLLLTSAPARKSPSKITSSAELPTADPEALHCGRAKAT